MSLYYLFIWNPYTKSNGNYTTRTFINSEILFIERTNYFDVDLRYNPSHVLGSSPNFKVNLNRSESKIVLPLSAEPADQPISIERFNWNANPGPVQLASASSHSLGNSEEKDGDRSSNSGGGGGSAAATNGRDAYPLALKRSTPSVDPSDYSGESNRYISQNAKSSEINKVN